MNFIKCLITVVTLSLLTISSYSQEGESDAYKFEEIEVIDSRSGFPISKLGKQVEIISQEDIADLPVKTIDELLRYTVGVEIQSRGMFGTQADISMRGATYNQTLVLLDGVRVNDALTGHFSAYIPVSLNAIERIEIIKGAGSTIYGSDAVGGVINIITKTVDEYTKRIENPTNTKEYEAQSKEMNSLLDLKLGDHSTYSVDFYRFYTGGSYNYDANYSLKDSYGYPAYNNTHNYDFNIHTGGGAMNFSLNESGSDFIAFRAAYDNRNFDARYFYTPSPFDQSEESVERIYGQSKLQIGGIEGHYIILNTGFIRTTDMFDFNPNIPANNHTINNLDINLYDKISLGSMTDLTIGSEVVYNTIESSDRGDHYQAQLGVYGLLLHNFSDEFNMNLGLRSETLPTGITELAPNVGLNYYLTEDVKIRANASRAIRSPDYTERFISTYIDFILPPGRNRGNPDLKPEISLNYELGTDIRILNGIEFNTTAYYRDADNLIDYVLTNSNEIKYNSALEPDSAYRYARNIEKLKTYGIEAQLKGSYNAFSVNNKQDVRWYFGGNYLKFSMEDELRSKYISNAAGLNLTAGFDIYYGGFNIGINGIYRKRDSDVAESINAELSESYFVIDSKLSYYFSDGISMYLEGRNILDEKYADILYPGNIGAELPGRWLFIGINMRRPDF